MRSLAAGSLDRMVAVLRVTASTPGRMNEAVETWGVLATVPAMVRPVSDGEQWRAGMAQVAAVATHRFTIRWGLGVGPRDRLWLLVGEEAVGIRDGAAVVLRDGQPVALAAEGREFEITGVKEIGRRIGQEITAVARGGVMG